MTNEHFERERRYQFTFAIVQILQREGLLTKDEFGIINKLLLEKHRPLLGSLHAGIII
jgi:hypothetical protein